jgi:hypothetical protein
LLQLKQFRKHFFNQTIRAARQAAYRPPPELPILLLLDPLVDVAPDPLVDVPLEPTVGALGATGALLGAVLPVAVLGGLPAPNGVGLRGIPAAPGGWTVGSCAAGLLGGRALSAMHCLIHQLFSSPM